MKIVKSPQPTFRNPEYIYIENWYSEEELDRVWKELEFYTKNTSSMERAEDTVVAHYPDGKAKGNHFRIYLDRFYVEKYRDISDILKYSQEGLLKESIRHGIEKKSPMYGRSFFHSNKHWTLVSYYEDKDHYAPHHDSFFWTQLIWLYKEPKKFRGGNLVLNDYKEVFECKNNSMLLFPSYYQHEVTPIQMEEENKNKGLGRYTITNFITNNG